MRDHRVAEGQSARSGVLTALLLATNFAGVPVGQADEVPAARAVQPLRIQLDAARNRRWVLNGDAVYVYDVARRHLIQRVDLPDWFYVTKPTAARPISWSRRQVQRL